MVMMMECWPFKLNAHFKLFLLILFVCIYLIFGALLFATLEKREDAKEVETLRRLKHEFEAKIYNCTVSVSDGDLERFLKEVVKATESGVLVTDNVTYTASWSFGQSLFFAATLLTTIGYGHTLPLSYAGKTFAIFYCLVGMPMILTMFSALVARLIKPAGSFLRLLRDKIGHRYENLTIEIIHLLTLTLAVLVLFFLIPSAIFCYLESDWNYMDSFYYCFISLTTIGLGDYIPGEKTIQPYRTLYKVGATIYLLLGLTCMMTLLAVLYNISVLNLSTYFALSSRRGDDCEEEILTSGSSSAPSYSGTDDEKVAE